MAGSHGLTAHDVTVEFPRPGRQPDVTVLRKVSLAVAPGEVVALLGPSGSGKSTLLRAIAGLERLTHGDVRWDGSSVVATPVHLRGFGLMFQDGQLFPHRDVAGNVAYGLTFPTPDDGANPAGARPSRAEKAERVAELLELVGLPGFEGRSVSTLSGGERQRVALARSLAPGPRLLMLDEPLSALDRSLRERLTGDVARILRDAGTTALYVTHDHSEARVVADRVGVLLAGELAQIGTEEELWGAPASAGVAEFLGT